VRPADCRVDQILVADKVAGAQKIKARASGQVAHRGVLLYEVEIEATLRRPAYGNVVRERGRAGLIDLEPATVPPAIETIDVCRDRRRGIGSANKRIDASDLLLCRRRILHDLKQAWVDRQQARVLDEPRCRIVGAAVTSDASTYLAITAGSLPVTRSKVTNTVCCTLRATPSRLRATTLLHGGET